MFKARITTTSNNCCHNSYNYKIVAVQVEARARNTKQTKTAKKIEFEIDKQPLAAANNNKSFLSSNVATTSPVS